MSCKSCSTGGCGTVKGEKVSGCENNGACGTGGCNKMNVFDWLSNMDVPRAMQFSIVEVKFKGGRKEYFRNTNKLELYTGDFVACEMASGYHLGMVSLQGELVRLQLLKKGIKEDSDLKTIYRKATDRDLEKHEQSIARDISTMYRSREIVKEYKLQMKLSDVEYQSDNTKATFYYSAEDRVDFRELIKSLATEFKVRVEMKQISLRQEAGRVGGIGSCGRELCCSTWLTDFKNIPTSAARYQNLSLNPSKLSGQCGRLKCCLNYELDTYIDALQDIPAVEKPLRTEKGVAHLQKTDIFRKLMWFGYGGDANWYVLPIADVVKVMAMNENGILPNSISDLTIPGNEPVEEKVKINQDLAQLDRKYTPTKRNGGNTTSTFKPNNNQQKPIAGTPRPNNNAPKPNVGTANPNNNTPKPIAGTPKPNNNPPKPITTPNNNAPKPIAGTPKPNNNKPNFRRPNKNEQ